MDQDPVREGEARAGVVIVGFMACNASRLRRVSPSMASYCSAAAPGSTWVDSTPQKALWLMTPKQ
jgi:hypothetical protein